MSYSSQVAVSFTKEDWEKEVYPKIKGLDGEKYLGDLTVNVDATLSYAEKVEKNNIITFRWQEYKSWGLDPLSKTLEQEAYDREGNFVRCGDKDIVENFANKAKQLAKAESKNNVR